MPGAVSFSRGGGAAAETVLTGGGTHTDIQDALDAFGAAGGCLKLGPGTWTIGAGITWPTTGNIWMTGCGEATILRKSAAGGYSLIQFPAGYTQAALISDMYMDLNGLAVSSNDAIQIIATGAADLIQIERCHFQSPGGAPSSGTTYIRDNQGVNHRLRIIDCKFLDGAGNHANIAIVSNNARVIRCVCVDELQVQGDDCVVDSCELQSINFTSSTGLKLINSFFNNAGASAITTGSNYDDIQIVGNTFTVGAGMTLPAINLTSTTAESVVVANNHILGALAGGIFLQRNDTRGVITGNIIDGVAGSAHGIELVSAGAGLHAKVHNNDVIGSSTGIGIRCEYDNTNISDNYVNGFTGGGIVEVDEADDNVINDNILESNGASQLVVIGPGSSASNNKLL